VIGYLRGTKAAVFILLMTLFALLITGTLGPTIIKYINALAKGFQFVLSGGLSALAGSGNASDALAELKNAPPLITEENQALVLGLIFVSIVVLAVLLSGIRWFKGSTHSFWGLLLGMISGYIVAAMFVRAFWPEYAVLMPLPFGWTVPPSGPIVIIPGAPTPSIWQRILAFLNSLVDQGLITVFLGVVIAVFLLIASRSLNKPAKKG
jgi:hypothetical protein